MTERTKKITLWSLAVILSTSLLFWWVRNAKEKIESFRGKEFIERLNFPKIEMPQIGEQKEELENKVNELQELIKNAEENYSTTTE